MVLPWVWWVLMGFTVFLPRFTVSLTDFDGLYRVLPWVWWILMGYMGSLMGFDGFTVSLMGYIGGLMGVNGFYREFDYFPSLESPNGDSCPADPLLWPFSHSPTSPDSVRSTFFAPLDDCWHDPWSRFPPWQAPVKWPRLTWQTPGTSPTSAVTACLQRTGCRIRSVLGEGPSDWAAPSSRKFGRWWRRRCPMYRSAGRAWTWRESSPWTWWADWRHCWRSCRCWCRAGCVGRGVCGRRVAPTDGGSRCCPRRDGAPCCWKRSTRPVEPLQSEKSTKNQSKKKIFFLENQSKNQQKSNKKNKKNFFNFLKIFFEKKEKNQKNVRMKLGSFSWVYDFFQLVSFLTLLYCPAVFDYYSPVPVKTDRAVQIQ